MSRLWSLTLIASALAYRHGSVSNFASVKLPQGAPSSEKQVFRQHRPQPFDTSNVYVHETLLPANVWNRIVPSKAASDQQAMLPRTLTSLFKLPTKSSCLTRNVDVTVEFDDPQVGAGELIEQCGLLKHLRREEMPVVLEHLSSCLHLYHQMVSCGAPFPDEDTTRSPRRSGVTKIRCKARIVASRGKAGLKCPRWHVDHVPLRLVCALEGPGVWYVDVDADGSRIDREFLNSSDEIDTELVNEAIIQGVQRDSIRFANTGEAVLLVGKAWGDERVQAAVHRTPEISPLQGRVLLTVDALTGQNGEGMLR